MVIDIYSPCQNFLPLYFRLTIKYVDESPEVFFLTNLLVKSVAVS